ncbi:MAG: CvpA family protein [Syntrophomonas sp.]|nr:CvpA family protein [Syntrophomonas sp.]
MGFNSLDYIIIAILLISGLIGYKRGFVASVGGIISTLVGVGIAFLYRDDAAAYLQEHFGVVSSLAAALEKRMPISAWSSNQPIPLSSLPGLNEGLAYIHRQFTELAYLLVVALCFLLLYMISSYLIKFFCMILEKMFLWGILGGMNQLAGAGTIITQNIIIIAVLLGVFNSPLGLGAKIGINGISQATGYIQGSALVPYLLKVFAFLQGMIAGGA